jgi:YHS domain-containing protein
MKKLLYSLLFLSYLCVIPLHAQINDKRIQSFNLTKGVAIQGYDPLSYFQNTPLKGSESFHYTYLGVKYYFVNEKNRDEFISAPDKYEPACGGWCAYAMAKSGDKVNINPLCYKIIDSKLYLFYNRFGINTLKKWNKKESIYLPLLTLNWKKYCC